MRFTDAFLRNLKTEKTMTDFREGAGFGVRVFYSGTKLFFFGYRFDGRRRFLKLGQYPACSLADARKKHREAQSKLDKGIDPLNEKQMLRVERIKSPTVAELINEYMEKHAIPKKKDWRKDKLCLHNDVLPAWAKRKACDIRRRDSVLLLESIVERGAPAQSNAVLEICRKMYNFAIERDILEHNPFFGVKPLGAKVVRQRYLIETEISIFWHNLDHAGMTDEMRRALKLILVTAQRPGEVIGIHRREINDHWWTIPTHRAKNGREHLVYLTDLALELIGDKKGFIFESPRSNEEKEIFKAIGVNAMANAVRQNCPTDCCNDCAICKDEECLKDERPMAEKNRLGISFVRPHDLRRTANTHMARLKVPLEHREAILNHARGQLDSIYNLHDYQDEKKAALERWGRELSRIIRSEGPSNVIEFMPVQNMPLHSFADSA